MEHENRVLLEDELRRFGVSASAEAFGRIDRHLEMVVAYNQQVNLTAITVERSMVVKHVIDSVAALSALKVAPGMRIADVGTGAGFPGVTFKCLIPELRLGLVESLGKRCRFLETVGAELFPSSVGAPDVPNGESFEVIWGRAEEIGQRSAYRERYDAVVARAVARLSVLAEYCLPFCRVGGEFLAMKGPEVSGELAEAQRGIGLLGGEVAEVRQIQLPDGAGERSLIRVLKVRRTPSAYPRRPGAPSRSPL